MQSYTATYINSNISIILWFFCKSKITFFPQDGSWRDWLCEQAACHWPRVGCGKQLAHKINLSQGQIFFACCLLQLSLRMGRPAAWWTRPGTSWSRRGCENPDQLVPGFNHQQSWHILLLTRTGWVGLCILIQERHHGQISFTYIILPRVRRSLGVTVPCWRLDGWQGHWLNRCLPVCIQNPDGWSHSTPLPPWSRQFRSSLRYRQGPLQWSGLKRDQDWKLKFPQPDYWPCHSPKFRTILVSWLDHFPFAKLAKREAR